MCPENSKNVGGELMVSFDDGEKAGGSGALAGPATDPR